MSTQSLRHCSRCGADTSREARAKYVLGQAGLVEICSRCEYVPRDLLNVFRELGYPEVSRDRSQPGYAWRDKE